MTRAHDHPDDEHGDAAAPAEPDYEHPARSPARHGHRHPGHGHADGKDARAGHGQPGQGDDHAGHGHGGHGHAGHGHGHAGHGHGGHHHAAPDRMTRAFALAVLLNLGFTGVEVVAGVFSRSTALLADAAHNFGDVLGLCMAWGAAALARRATTTRRTYGLRRTTILAALGNGGLVLFAVGGVAWEAVQRLGAPHEVEGTVVAAVAAVGVVLNSASALLFARRQAHDMNVRGAYLHLVADAAVSGVVVVAGLVVWRTGWSWVDPAASLAVSAVIVSGTWRLVREALDLLLDSVPRHIDPQAVEAYLAGLPGVTGVHDLHIWSMSTTEVALTAHVILPWDTCAPTLLADASAEIARRFHIGHVTIQLEPTGHGERCDRAIAGAL